MKILGKSTLILLICLGFTQLQGQTLHLNLGASLSKLDWTYLDLTQFGIVEEHQYHDPLQSFAVSAELEYFEHDYYSISSNIMFYKSGGKYAEDEFDKFYVFQSPSEIAASYLSLGSSFNMYPVNKKFKVRISAGPRVDYIFNSADNQPYTWIAESDGLSKLNFGITLGAGLYYQLNDFIIGCNAQYLQRIRKLADVTPTRFDTGGVEATEKVGLFFISLGYRLNALQK